MQRLSVSILALSILVAGNAAQAEPVAAPYLPVVFSGFGTLGAVHVQGDGAAFVRDMTQPKGATNRGISWDLDTRIGLQANYKPREDIEAVAQIVSRYRFDNNYQPELTWGFLKYAPNENFEFRAGRVGFDAYLSSDSRDIGYSFLWVRPPVDYYGSLFFSYEDGGDMLFRMPLGNGVGRVKLFTGIARERTASMVEQREWADNRTTGPIGSTQDLDGSRGKGGFIDYQDKHWITRVGIAKLKITRDFPLGSMNLFGLMRASANAAAQGNPPNLPLANALNAFVADAMIANKEVVFKSLAIAYEHGPLQTQMALSHQTSNSLLLTNSHAGFVSAGYRIDKLTPYAMLSAVRSQRSKRSDELSGLASAAMVNLTNFTVSAPLIDQTTYTLGARYDIARNVALKFQLDMIHNSNCSPVRLPGGTGASCAPPRLWSSVPVGWNGRADVYSAVVDFTF